MSKVLIFLAGVVVGGAGIFFVLDKSSLLSGREVMTSSAGVDQRMSGPKASNEEYPLDDLKSPSILEEKNFPSEIETEVNTVLKTDPASNSAEILIHPSVSKLLKGWSDEDKAHYWGYLSSAYGLPNKGYTEEALRHVIKRMPPQVFSKFLFEVTRDTQLLDSYRADMQSLSKVENQATRQVRAFEYRQRLAYRTVEQLKQTNIISFQ